MNLINDKKLSLLVKLIIGYALLLNFAFLVFSLTAVSTTDVASVTASLLGWTATLYTPVAAYLLYDSWKDQKSYDLKKEIITKILEGITATRYPMIKRIRRATELTGINEKFILLKNFKSIKIDQDDSPHHIQVYVNIEIYEYLTNDEKIRDLYRWYESYYMQIDKIHGKIYNIYNDYYNKIGPELSKYIHENSILSQPYNIDIKESNFLPEIRNMKDLIDEKFYITYDGKSPIAYYETYSEMTENFESKANELLKLLVKKIEI